MCSTVSYRSNLPGLGSRDCEGTAGEFILNSVIHDNETYEKALYILSKKLQRFFYVPDTVLLVLQNGRVMINGTSFDKGV